MTISLTSDDKTFEQVKKQLNRSVEVIKLIDFTDLPVHLKELMFIKITNCTTQDMTEIFRIAQVFKLTVLNYTTSTALLESLQPENKNNDLLNLLMSNFPNRIEIARGGSVGIEAIHILEK